MQTDQQLAEVEALRAEYIDWHNKVREAQREFIVCDQKIGEIALRLIPLNKPLAADLQLMAESCRQFPPKSMEIQERMEAFFQARVKSESAEALRQAVNDEKYMYSGASTNLEQHRIQLQAIAAVEQRLLLSTVRAGVVH